MNAITSASMARVKAVELAGFGYGQLRYVHRHVALVGPGEVRTDQGCIDHRRALGEACSRQSERLNIAIPAETMQRLDHASRIELGFPHDFLSTRWPP